jgi:hypothetical protein
MTDYKRSTGSSGTMMIRDYGNTVEFWLTSSSGSTFAHELPWGYTVNGITNNDREFDYSAGAGWARLGSWSVTTDQTVSFRIFDTNTSGFGGPTTLSAFLNRSSAPNPPAISSISSITATSVVVRTTDGLNNGAGIDLRSIAYNEANQITGSTVITATGNTTTVTGLTPGQLYYFFARTHNAKGYSGWSPVKSATTLRVPDAPDAPIVSDATQTSVLVSFTDNGNGGSPITEREIGYGTNTVVGVEHSVTYTGVMTITGLHPGTVYYFWSRARNVVGWGPYSVSRSLKTVAGGSVNVNGVWKDAIPYVKDGGTWKIARPWSRITGVWKQST